MKQVWAARLATRGTADARVVAAAHGFLAVQASHLCLVVFHADSGVRCAAWTLPRSLLALALLPCARTSPAVACVLHGGSVVLLGDVSADPDDGAGPRAGPASKRRRLSQHAGPAAGDAVPVPVSFAVHTVTACESAASRAVFLAAGTEHVAVCAGARVLRTIDVSVDALVTTAVCLAPDHAAILRSVAASQPGSLAATLLTRAAVALEDDAERVAVALLAGGSGALMLMIAPLERAEAVATHTLPDSCHAHQRVLALHAVPGAVVAIAPSRVLVLPGDAPLHSVFLPVEATAAAAVLSPTCLVYSSRHHTAVYRADLAVDAATAAAAAVSILPLAVPLAGLAAVSPVRIAVVARDGRVICCDGIAAAVAATDSAAATAAVAQTHVSSLLADISKQAGAATRRAAVAAELDTRLRACHVALAIAALMRRHRRRRRRSAAPSPLSCELSATPDAAGGVALRLRVCNTSPHTLLPPWAVLATARPVASSAAPRAHGALRVAAAGGAQDSPAVWLASQRASPHSAVSALLPLPAPLSAATGTATLHVILPTSAAACLVSVALVHPGVPPVPVLRDAPLDVFAVAAADAAATAALMLPPPPPPLLPWPRRAAAAAVAAQPAMLASIAVAGDLPPSLPPLLRCPGEYACRFRGADLAWSLSPAARDGTSVLQLHCRTAAVLAMAHAAALQRVSSTGVRRVQLHGQRGTADAAALQDLLVPMLETVHEAAAVLMRPVPVALLRYPGIAVSLLQLADSLVDAYLAQRRDTRLVLYR